MAKSREEVERTVKQVLQEFVGAGHAVEANDKPMTSLGLTSADGVDFACELQKRLGCAIPPKINPFVADENNSAERSVSQIVDFVSTLCSTKEEK